MVTRWSPDTCECVIEYNDDGTLSNVVKACDAHKGDNDEVVFQNVKEENPRKNNAVKEILDNAPSSMFDVDAESGTRVFKRGINVDFAWTGTVPNRKLALTVKGLTLTSTQKNAVQNKLDNRFGAGKVTVEQG
jgi:hypothetical protein